MEFIRKKRRGQSAKTQRTWFSEEGYRVYWRKERYGVALTPAYMACVRVTVPNFGQDLHSVPEAERQTAKTAVVWDFVDHKHHLHKKMKTAQEACEKHKRLWTKACEATGIRGLVEIFGKLPTGIPVWARKKLSRKTFELLTRYVTPRYEEEDECLAPSAPDGSMSSPSDPIEACKSLPPSSTGSDCTLPTSGPVSLVPAEDGTTTRKTRRARSKATETGAPSPAPPVEAPAKGRRKPAAKPTKRQSPASAKKRKSTKGSSKPGGKRSRSSRQRKSKPSGS